jgi:hypothetical protein
MAILSPEQHAALVGELAKPEYADLSDEAVADVLNAPREIPNPDPQGEVPRPFLASEVMGLLDPATIGNLRTIAYLPTIVGAINANDRPAVALWTNQLTAGGIISPGQAGAIMGLLSETIPDPDWPETVIAPSWTSEHFPGSGYIDDDGVSHAKRVTPDMVTEARS